MTSPESDPDLNPQYRAKATERAESEQRIRHINVPSIFSTIMPDPNKPRVGWLQKRQSKVAAEIERNRAGDYRVPTWVLTLILVAVIVGLVLLFMFG
jgi:hypothetical protein